MAMRTKFPDMQNLTIGQLDHGVFYPLPPRPATMLKSVKGVFAFCIPTKVCQGIVVFIAVAVATLLSGRTRANKSQKNQTVDFKKGLYSVRSKVNSVVSSNHIGFQKPGWSGCYKLSPRDVPFVTGIGSIGLPERSDSPGIRDLVTRKPFNRQPSLLNLIGDCVKLVITHGLNLLRRFESWGGPFRCFNTVRPVLFNVPQTVGMAS